MSGFLPNLQMRTRRPGTARLDRWCRLGWAAGGRTLLAVLLLVSPAMAQTAPVGRVAFPGSHKEVAVAGGDARSAALTRATLTPAEADALLEIEVGLRMRDLAGLQLRVHRGEKIPPAELAATYQPAAADYKAVTDWLVGEGLTIVRTDPGRVGVFARGTVRQLAAAFQVTFARVAFHGSEYTSAVSAPSLPGSLAGAVLGINGLQPQLRAHKHLVPGPVPLSTSTTTAVPYWPRDILGAYGGGGLAQTGAGQTIGIIIDSFPADSDLTSFWTTTGVNQSLANIEEVQVGSGALPAPSGEETLDVEWASGIAPGAKVRVYATADLSSSSLDEAYAQVCSEVAGGSQPNLNQLSMSYGTDEATEATSGQIQLDEQYFSELAALGVAVFASSGDAGSSPNFANNPPNFNYPTGTSSVEYPSSSPNVTAVGGTSLVLASTGSIMSETAWNSTFTSSPGVQTHGATGGGISLEFARPAWQTGAGVPTGTARLVPDIAAAGDPADGGLIVLNGAQLKYGGTSWSSPTWAGFCALLNQARASSSQGPIGLLAPNLYPLLGTGSFRDITTGNNGAFSAGVGYDECTGIGVPNLPALLVALTSAPPSLVASPVGLTVSAGQNAVFTGLARGFPMPNFQWQFSTNGGSTWTNLSDGNSITGSTTGTLTLVGLTTGYSGQQFRLVATNSSGTTTSAPVTLTVLPQPFVTAMAAGNNFSLFVKSDGSLWATGGNNAGQLGNGTTTSCATPQQIVSGGVTAVAAGYDHSLFLKSDGSLWAMGDNTYGELGDGTTTNRSNPEKVLPDGVTAIAAGGGFSLILKSDGSLWGMGANSSGNLGDGTTTNRSVPEEIVPGGVTAIAAGATTSVPPPYLFSLYLTSTGSLWAMGDNSFGELGDGTTTSRLSPEQILTGGVTAISAGFVHTLFLKSDGSLWAMGDNTYGELGDGTTNDQLAPEEILTSGVTAIAAGALDSLFVKSNGSLWATGWNGDAQLGDGTTNDRSIPEQIESGGVTAVSPGGVFNLFLRGATGLWAMGNNNDGNLGDGTVFSPVLPEQTLGGDPATTASVVLPPANATVVAGANASFSVTATGFPLPTYQWQVSTDGGVTWNNVGGGGYSGAASATLTVVAPTSADLGYQYRAVITNAGGTFASAPATLLVGTSNAKLTWLQNNFSLLQLGDPAVVGDQATPAGDGIPNLLKYAFNLPALTNGQGLLPQLTQVNGKPGFVFQAQRVDVTYTVQASTNLVNWSTTGVTTAINGTQVSASYSPSGNPAAFLRIVVTTGP